ncbi:MAG: YchJ family protein [Thermodesulfobacteriota bacterium]
MSECPCGSKQPYSQCCEPLHKGAPALTAEQLMRSRYSAYVKVELDYLQETIHPQKRADHNPDSAREWAEQSVWDRLEILETTGGGQDDQTGEVEFIAHYADAKGRKAMHHERALFEKDNGRWYFKDGNAVTPQTIRRDAPKVGRNDPCPCGSGKKFKKCCGA